MGKSVTGSIQEKRGKYHVVYRVDGKQHWKCTNIEVGDTKKKRAKQYNEAVVWMNKFLEGVKSSSDSCCNDRSNDSTKRAVMVDELASVWIEHVKKSVKSTTYQCYESCIKRRVIPYFGEHKVKVSDVTTQDITDFIEFESKHSLVGKDGVSRSSLSYYRSVLSSMFVFAVQNGLSQNNPVQYCRMPKDERKIEICHDDVYSGEELKTLIDYAHENSPRFIWLSILILSHTGMRRGELLGLCWDMVDLENGCVKICRNRPLQNERTVDTVTSPKTKKSIRTICLPQIVTDALREEKHEQDRDRMSDELYKKYDLDFVIRMDGGKIPNCTTVSVGIKRAMRNAGLRVIKVHAIRHSVATVLFDKGASLRDISTLLGHSSTAVTERVYTHKTNVSSRNTSDLIANSIC